MPAPAPILVIEPDPARLGGALELLARERFPVQLVATATAALAALANDYFEVVLLDLELPDLPGLDLLTRIRREAAAPEVVVVTGQGSIATAVEAMKKGAYDFLIKPVAPERVLVAARNAAEHRRLQGAVAILQGQTNQHGFIGEAPAMQAVYKMIESAAASKASVFITGESGTGKDVCAHAIHEKGGRRARPLVALNCAAIPRELMESEIFGHVKGAFTGATTDREGAAKQADGGTLFLDEICELPLDLQAKLLRFLQSGSFQQVGGSKTEQVDVRIIAATNREPWQEVEQGRFREDLYYRLHVIPLSLPPLREREQDVLLLAQHFLGLYAREEGKVFAGLSPEVENMLMAYDWPGNVRQLQNIIRNIVVMQNGGVVQPAMVPPPVGGRWARPQGFTSVAPSTTTMPLVVKPLAIVEREAIENAIAVCGGNIPKAAAILGVNPSTLYRKREAWQKGVAEG